MGQAGGRILERHGACEANALLETDVRRHARAPDGRAGRGVVDDDDGFEAECGLGDMDNLFGPQVVGEAERVVHCCVSIREEPSSRVCLTAFRNVTASAPVTHR